MSYFAGPINNTICVRNQNTVKDLSPVKHMNTNNILAVYGCKHYNRSQNILTTMKLDHYAKIRPIIGLKSLSANQLSTKTRYFCIFTGNGNVLAA